MLKLHGALIPDFDSLALTSMDVLIDGGRFADIAESIPVGCDTVDAGGMLMLPGMTDTHTHMVQSLTMGLLDDLNITDWLRRMLAVQWALTDEDWYNGVLLGCLQSLRNGVTAINEMTYFPCIDAVAQAYRDSGLRVTFGIGATDMAENELIKLTPLSENIRQAEYIYNTYHGKGLLKTSVAPQGRPCCTPELMTSLKAFANERGLIFHTHLAEGRAETEGVHTSCGRWEAEELSHIGVLDQHTVLAHSIWLKDYELDILAESGAWVAHCPSTNMKLSDGVPRIADMLGKGVNVAFGCDGEASSSNRDILREARHGSYLQKAFTLDPTVLPVGECYKMLTENGASALGYDDAGCIKKGFSADFSLIRLDELCMINKKRILSDLLYAGSGGYVDTVYVAGECLYKNGRFTRQDMPRLTDAFRETAARAESLLPV